jgi:hypothetical protein
VLAKEIAAAFQQMHDRKLLNISASLAGKHEIGPAAHLQQSRHATT